MAKKTDCDDANTYAFCSNPECGASYEFSEIGPPFCSRCKYPLFTNCLSCGAPFLYRPEKFCGVCSSDLASDGRTRSWLMLLAYRRLRKDGEAPVQGFETLLTRSAERLTRIEQFFPCLEQPESIRKMLEERGLDILLSPPAANRKSLLKIVDKD